ncbi:MAG: 30S ribosomal protein S5 [Candidatus Kerfeldbacteria bacterium]
MPEDTTDKTKKEPVAKEDTAPKPEVPKTEEAPKQEVAKPAISNRNKGGRGGGSNRGDRKSFGDPRKGRGKGRGRRRDNKPQDEFDSKIIDLARVTRVMAGGKRMRFRACVLVGDKKGRIGMGVKKGADVQLAVQKATDYAKKHLMTVPVVEGTIPHKVEIKFKASRVMLKPAKAGTGIIAGGPVRIVMEMAGVKNIVAKIKGSSNKVNNVTSVMNALSSLRTAEDIKKIKE